TAHPPSVNATSSGGASRRDVDGGTGAEEASVAERPRRTTQVLSAPSSTEIDAIRPLLARGPAVIIRNADAGPDARITFVTRAHAPLAMVHETIAAPGEYASFMPILRSVELLSTHENRTAFRFHVAAPLFDVTAL